MKANLEEDSSGSIAVSDVPPAEVTSIPRDFVAGGYSVWDCPPPIGPKMPPSDP